MLNVASRYHWVNTAYDTSFPVGGGALPNLDIDIPAGATMKRFLTRDIRVIGTTSGYTVQRVSPQYMRWRVKIISGEYAPRVLYQATYSIPYTAVCLYDNASVGTAFARVYSMFELACDKEQAINEKCSYGLATGAGFTVRVESSVNQQAGTPAFMSGDASATFAALYYL